MHINTPKKQKLNKIKNSSGGCASLPSVPKLGVSGVKDTAKTNKDCSMPCCIPVEYSVFFHWYIFYDHVKIIFINILQY